MNKRVLAGLEDIQRIPQSLEDLTALIALVAIGDARITPNTVVSNNANLLEITEGRTKVEYKQFRDNRDVWITAIHPLGVDGKPGSDGEDGQDGEDGAAGVSVVNYGLIKKIDQGNVADGFVRYTLSFTLGSGATVPHDFDVPKGVAGDEGEDGAAGVSITAVAIVRDGITRDANITFTLSEGNPLVVPVVDFYGVKGDKGDDGDAGRGIKDYTIVKKPDQSGATAGTTRYTLTFEFGDDATRVSRNRGIDIPDGVDGAAGVSITGVAIAKVANSRDANITFNLSVGNPVVVLADNFYGADGTSGDDGVSITGIAISAKDGIQRNANITFNRSVGNPTIIPVENFYGADGAAGDDGVSITGVAISAKVGDSRSATMTFALSVGANIVKVVENFYGADGVGASTHPTDFVSANYYGGTLRLVRRNGTFFDLNIVDITNNTAAIALIQRRLDEETSDATLARQVAELTTTLEAMKVKTDLLTKKVTPGAETWEKTAIPNLNIEPVGIMGGSSGDDIFGVVVGPPARAKVANIPDVVRAVVSTKAAVSAATVADRPFDYVMNGTIGNISGLRLNSADDKYVIVLHTKPRETFIGETNKPLVQFGNSPPILGANASGFFYNLLLRPSIPSLNSLSYHSIQINNPVWANPQTAPAPPAGTAGLDGAVEESSELDISHLPANYKDGHATRLIRVVIQRYYEGVLQSSTPAISKVFSMAALLLNNIRVPQGTETYDFVHTDSNGVATDVTQQFNIYRTANKIYVKAILQRVGAVSYGIQMYFLANTVIPAQASYNAPEYFDRDGSQGGGFDNDGVYSAPVNADKNSIRDGNPVWSTTVLVVEPGNVYIDYNGVSTSAETHFTGPQYGMIDGAILKIGHTGLITVAQIYKLSVDDASIDVAKAAFLRSSLEGLGVWKVKHSVDNVELTVAATVDAQAYEIKDVDLVIPTITLT